MNEIASVALLPRNDGILNGILNEIASVALLPRNDGISAMADEFRIYCDEIPPIKLGDDKEGQAGG